MEAQSWRGGAERVLKADADRAALVVQLVALAFGQSPDTVAGENRVRSGTLARHVAQYLAHVALEMPLERVAAVFRKNRTSIGYACRRVEDERDDPAFDDRLTELERCLRGSPAVTGGAA